MNKQYLGGVMWACSCVKFEISTAQDYNCKAEESWIRKKCIQIIFWQSILEIVNKAVLLWMCQSVDGAYVTTVVNVACKIIRKREGFLTTSYSMIGLSFCPLGGDLR